MMPTKSSQEPFDENIDYLDMNACDTRATTTCSRGAAVKSKETVNFDNHVLSVHALEFNKNLQNINDVSGFTCTATSDCGNISKIAVRNDCSQGLHGSDKHMLHDNLHDIPTAYYDNNQKVVSNVESHVASRDTDSYISRDKPRVGLQGPPPLAPPRGLCWHGATTISSWLRVHNHQVRGEQCIVVSASEATSDSLVEFEVSYKCSIGVCACTHLIRDRRAQLKTCRFFCEVFLRGDIDPDWEYLIRGVCFGFQAIDPDCAAEYKPQFREVRDPHAHTIMSDKLSKEILDSVISEMGGKGDRRLQSAGGDLCKLPH